MEFGENGAVIVEHDKQNNAGAKTSSIHAYVDGPRSLIGLFYYAAIGLTAYMIVELLMLLAVGFLVWLYVPSTSVPFEMSTLEQIDLAITLVGIAQLVVFWVCAFLIARCTFRAMRNLYTINSKHAEMSPGWTVGWYFIPIASLFKPAEGMSQIVRGTKHAVGNSKVTRTGIPLWWTFWLLTNVTQTVASQIMRFSGGSIDSTTQITALSFDGASSLFGILSAWALMRVLRPVVEDHEDIRHGGVAHVFD